MCDVFDRAAIRSACDRSVRDRRPGSAANSVNSAPILQFSKFAMTIGLEEDKVRRDGGILDHRAALEASFGDFEALVTEAGEKLNDAIRMVIEIRRPFAEHFAHQNGLVPLQAFHGA